MSSLSEQYKQISSYFDDIRKRISKNEERIAAIRSDSSAEISERIANLEATLERVDEYIYKIRGIQERVRHSLSNPNVPTITTYPGYKVNINRLREWMFQIDPNSGDDPYAQRVMCVAKCDEQFLLEKKEEFTKKLNELRENLNYGLNAEINRLTAEIDSLKNQLSQYIDNNMEDFCRTVHTENRQFIFNSQTFSNCTDMPEYVSFGAYEASLHLPKDLRGKLKPHLNDFFNENTGRVKIPFIIDTQREFVINIRCASSKRNALDKAIQNFALQLIDRYPAGSQKIYCLDAVRLNSTGLYPLKPIEKSFALSEIPKTEGDLSAMLQDLVSSMSDMDEYLKNYDSVAEYNEVQTDNKLLPRSTIIIYGWDGSFGNEERELVLKLLRNYERYGFSFIIVRYGNIDAKDEKRDIPEYAYDSSIKITISSKDSLVSFDDGEPQKFSPYSFDYNALSQEYPESLLSNEISKTQKGSVYTDRFDLTLFPQYVCGNKRISVPYGVDAKDNEHYLTFDNENFAMYLMGASGSGKSTLLHTIITGILRQYHPDDVELWLADFKMSEFSQYIDPMPPHVKYILLDESRELVFDLIDKLTDKMMERQKYFMFHKDKKKVEEVGANDKYMPIIFVILDEFSIMSQAVSESEPYRLKLQNLLAKGRALGIKFIFSSQTFIKGIMGLTNTAKDQIQMRIAMKNSYDEIEQTLSLISSEKTEQVKTWMSALPPHYTLVKYRDGDSNRIERYNVMYFKGENGSGGSYAAQADFIRMLNKRIKPVDFYNPDSINTYVEKNPVVVDGNSYSAFLDCAKSIPSDRHNKYISFGSPRLMSSHYFVSVTNETRENILLIARYNDRAYTTSIILSAAKLWLAQKGEVEIWAYERSPVFAEYRNVFKKLNIKTAIGSDEVCDRIRVTKKEIKAGKKSDRLVVFIGIERICGDFSFYTGETAAEGASIEKRKQMAEKAAPKSQEEWLQTYYKQKLIVEQNKCKTEKEKKQVQDKLVAEWRTASEELKRTGELPSSITEKTENDSENSSGAYDAAADFTFIVKQGSRFGTHFFLHLSDISEIREIGLNMDWFRHRLSFQISKDDSQKIFGSTKLASALPEHICQYSNTTDSFSFRPYLHNGIEWDGWSVDENGDILSPFFIEN